MDKTTLASNWVDPWITEGGTLPQLLAKRVTTVPDICPYGQNTSDQATLTPTPLQEFISELFPVMASDE